MATASVPPPMAKRMDRDRRLLNQLESADPVTRWKARQYISNQNMERLSNSLVSQAKANARALEEREREAQRIEQEYYKNKYKEI